MRALPLQSEQEEQEKKEEKPLGGQPIKPSVASLPKDQTDAQQSRTSEPIAGALADRPDRFICSYALKNFFGGGLSKKPEWSTSNWRFVEEAKGRGLSIFRCFQILG